VHRRKVKLVVHGLFRGSSDSQWIFDRVHKYLGADASAGMGDFDEADYNEDQATLKATDLAAAIRDTVEYPSCVGRSREQCSGCGVDWREMKGDGISGSGEWMWRRWRIWFVAWILRHGGRFWTMTGWLASR
jgi:hypothetical protein